MVRNLAMGRRFASVGLVAVVALGAAPPASAHVAPSFDVNNRYLKLSPLGDRIRLAYTVVYGDLPGAAARRSLDTSGDGQLSDEEGDAFGRALAAEVAPALTVTVDGAPLPVTWAEVHVGLGTPTTAAGAFSVDLIAWLCLPAGDRHTLVLRDRHALPSPGETGVRIEDGTGIRVEAARLGAEALPTLDASWQGAGGPLADPGLTIAFAVLPAAPRPHDGMCGAAATAAAPPRLWRWALPAVFVAMVGATAVFVRRYYRKMNG